ncbi:MAG: hypothetical protein JXA57_10110 [Armatimonadetes bacterium]|nr:hypothetical protein [Armatimonadota bacterium]MBN2822928.1 hypothetical protein [Coriobacteriia bacterium]
MVQLSMLSERKRPSLTETLEQLEFEARSSGAGRDAALYASRAVTRRFWDELGKGQLDSRSHARVQGYYRAVLDRAVYRRKTRSDRDYRERARVRAAAVDLESIGITGAALRRELVETLGMDSTLVDRVVGATASVA